jgi:hypothetical protein
LASEISGSADFLAGPRSLVIIAREFRSKIWGQGNFSRGCLTQAHEAVWDASCHGCFRSFCPSRPPWRVAGVQLSPNPRKQWERSQLQTLVSLRARRVGQARCRRRNRDPSTEAVSRRSYAPVPECRLRRCRCPVVRSGLVPTRARGGMASRPGGPVNARRSHVRSGLVHFLASSSPWGHRACGRRGRGSLSWTVLARRAALVGAVAPRPRGLFGGGACLWAARVRNWIF